METYDILSTKRQKMNHDEPVELDDNAVLNLTESWVTKMLNQILDMPSLLPIGSGTACQPRDGVGA